MSSFGRLDVMVNNAGVYRAGKRLHEFTEEDLDVCFDVNAKGTFFGAKANLTRCLAIAFGKDGIRVNGICPTYARTSLTRALFDDKDFDQAFNDSIPLKRWGEVDDIANLAIFLASEESTEIHGDLIKVDGGETLGRYSV